jgi:hypothetical protein
MERAHAGGDLTSFPCARDCSYCAVALPWFSTRLPWTTASLPANSPDTKTGQLRGEGFGQTSKGGYDLSAPGNLPNEGRNEILILDTAGFLCARILSRQGHSLGRVLGV